MVTAVVSIWLAAATALAGPTLTHQGRLLDVGGQPIVGPRAIRVTLYDTEAAPSGFWTRQFSNVPVEDGYFAVALVTDDASQPLDAQDFADGDTWVGVEVDSVALGARQPLASVPYAIAAGTAGGGLSCGSGGTWCPPTTACSANACIAATNDGSHMGAPGQSCKQIRATHKRPDGLYWIDPGLNGAPFRAYCDMSTDGGGWTLIALATTGSAVYNWSTGGAGLLQLQLAPNTFDNQAGQQAYLSRTEMDALGARDLRVVTPNEHTMGKADAPFPSLWDHYFACSHSITGYAARTAWVQAHVTLTNLKTAATGSAQCWASGNNHIGWTGPSGHMLLGTNSGQTSYYGFCVGGTCWQESGSVWAR